MRSRLSLQIMMITLVAMGATGCSLVKSFLRGTIQEPQVAIRGVQVTEMRLNGVELLFHVELFNPNPFGVRFAGVDYEVEVDGTHFANGQTESALDLRGEEKTMTDFTVHVPFASLGESILGFLAREKVDYLLKTNFRMGTEDSFLRVPAQFPGQLILPKVPDVSVRDFSFPSVSTEALTTRLVLEVNNPNDFDVPVDAFGIHVILNHQEILSHTSIAGRRLTAHQSVDIPFEMKVDFKALGLSVQNILKRPKWQWKVGIELVTGNISLPFFSEGAVQLSQKEAQLLNRLVENQASGETSQRVSMLQRRLDCPPELPQGTQVEIPRTSKKEYGKQCLLRTRPYSQSAISISMNSNVAKNLSQEMREIQPPSQPRDSADER
jgi:LEA14-like dessication related protein